jgi:hypothetical protein
VGPYCTVSVAVFVVASLPIPFVKTARYCTPLSPAAAVKEYVTLVAPAISDQPLPLFDCHLTVGVGLPLAAAVKVTVAPDRTVWLVG